MKIRVGFEMEYQCRGPTPMILALSIHYSRASDWCTRLSRYESCGSRYRLPGSLRQLVQPHRGAARAVRTKHRCRGQRQWPGPMSWPPGDAGPDRASARIHAGLSAGQPLLRDGPALRHRWQHFGNGPTGWARVQAICDFVHRHIEFGYPHARNTRTAWEAYKEGRGVCRDYAHLAIASAVA